jgi:hypothetical protein
MPGIVSTGIIFHLHTYMHSVCIIFTFPHFFPAYSPSHWYQSPQDRTCSALLFVLWFCKRKNDIFVVLPDDYWCWVFLIYLLAIYTSLEKCLPRKFVHFSSDYLYFCCLVF